MNEYNDSSEIEIAMNEMRDKFCVFFFIFLNRLIDISIYNRKHQVMIEMIYGEFDLLLFL